MNFIVAFVIAAAMMLVGSSFLPINGFMFASRQFAPCDKIADIDRSGTVFQRRGRPVESQLFLSPDDLTNYMAKAHEEKIRALKEIEDKKNAEILALQEELQSLKQKSTGGSLTTAPASGSMDFNSMTKEELAAKVVSYQQFMSKYIVEAQQQKMLAVKAAEAAAASKYEAKLKLLIGGSDSTATPPPLARVQSSPETRLYDERSANVAAAARSGKSRWGDQEVAKATQAANGIMVNGVKLPADVTSPPAPIAVPATTTISSGTSLYNNRNAMVAAAGAAGKSRWGEAEIKRATEEAAIHRTLSASEPLQTAEPIPQVIITPEIEAADHGLRNDGGVGGPSLAQRVNLGMKLFEGGLVNGLVAPLAPVIQVVASPTLFEARNARVAAAAAAGKSRWGPMENKRSTELVGVAVLSPGVSTAAIPPEVIEADHGLRADGGVGGPTLAQRVNLGANLLGL